MVNHKHVLAIAAASVLSAATPGFANQGQAQQPAFFGAPYGYGQAYAQAMPQMHAPQAITGYDARYPQTPLAQQKETSVKPQTYATSVGYNAYSGYNGHFGPAYGAPVASDYANVPGYPAPVAATTTTMQGYAIPGATSAPFYVAPAYGFPAPGLPGFGYSPFDYAPAEPQYAPAERFGSSAAPAAPAPVAEAAPAEAPKAAIAPASETTSYSYQLAPANSEVYVGTTKQIDPASSYQTTTTIDPYSVVTQPTQTNVQPVYQPYEPSYQTYEQAAPQQPSYAAPAAPVQSYEAYQQAPTTTYEYESAAPQQVYVEPAPVVAAPSYAYAPQSGHFVQVAAFLDPARAERLVGKLQSKGENAFIVEADVRGRHYYRVRVPATDKREARYVRDRIRNLGFYEARVVKG